MAEQRGVLLGLSLGLSAPSLVWLSYLGFSWAEVGGGCGHFVGPLQPLILVPTKNSGPKAGLLDQLHQHL